MVYYDVPVVYRYHGVDYLRSHKLPYELGYSLFNVVSSSDLNLIGSVRSSEDLIFAHCSRRVLVPRITHYVYESIGNTLYKFLYTVIDNREVVCDIAEPVYELSTRRKILRRLKGDNAVYDGKGDFTVLSSISSAYVNISVGSGIECRRYMCQSLDYPSAWMNTGKVWVLRAYPTAIRLRYDKVNDDGSVDGNVIRDKIKGSWCHVVGDKYVKIPPSDLYDDELCMKFRFGNNSPNYYYVSGNKTIVYFESDDGMPLVKVQVPTLQMSRLCVTVKNSRNVFGQQNELFNVKKAESVRTFDDVTVFTFQNEHDAYSFMRINVHMKKKMWMGDLRKFYCFPDPMSNGYMLLPDMKHFIDGSYFNFPLEVNQIMNVKGVYDPVGNYYAESSGENVFETFDYDECDTPEFHRYDPVDAMEWKG